MKPVLNMPDFRILRSVERENTGRELICRRVTSLYYITDEHNVADIAAVFISDPSINALAVTDNDRKVLGIIVKGELLSLIGQKFGRELYSGKSIKDVSRPACLVYYRRNTFSVIDQLSESLKSGTNTFYVVVDGENRYRGLFSSFDLVLFLSEMMTKELKSARRIHSAIVRDIIKISTGRIEITGSVIMAGESGGDFIYVRKLDDGRWFISLCDVSGKGLNAGLISVAVTSMYAAYDFTGGIKELICTINSYIHDLFGGEIFLTGVFIEFNGQEEYLDVYDMGHSMIYLFRNGKVFSPFSSNNNLPLGVKKEIVPAKSRMKPMTEDLILSYTDGFPEQNNLSDEEFGERRLLSIVMKHRHNDPEIIKNILLDEVKDWRLGNSQGDDMSLLVMKYK